MNPTPEQEAKWWLEFEAWWASLAHPWPDCNSAWQGYLAAKTQDAARIAELEKNLEREQSDALQTILDRDRAEKYIDKILDAVIGTAPDHREEWSSGHDFPDALGEVEDHMWGLKQASDATDAQITTLQSELAAIREGQEPIFQVMLPNKTWADGSRTDYDLRAYVAPSEARKLYLHPPAQPASEKVDANTICRIEGDAQQSMVIRIEKLMCEKLGKPWAASGISIVSLIDELAAKPPAAQVPDDPVAWRSRHVNYVGWTLSEWELPMREGQEQQPLYLDRRCATIPDSLHMRDVTHPKATNPEEAWMYATGWNACRAAMIEGEKK